MNVGTDKYSYLQNVPEGVQVHVFVQPGGSKNSLIGEVTSAFGPALKIKLKAPPVDGKANKALIEFFSHLFDVSKSKIEIIKGETSRNKKLQISGLSYQQAKQILTIEMERE